MVGPIRFEGLMSGIDFSSIITRLLDIQRQPILRLQDRITQETTRKTGLLKISANLLSMRSSMDLLSRPSFLNRTTATSSNENVLVASGDQVSTTGAFTFSVARLAQTHTLVSNGFADDDTVVAPAGGQITLERGNGFLDRDTPLTLLNGQNGVDRGFVKVTDSAGKVAILDLQGAMTANDVLEAFNTQTQVAVSAGLAGDRFVVRDQAGGVGTLKIENYGADATASDLGLAKSGVAVDGVQYVFGDDVNRLSSASELTFLNDGLGVRRNSDALTDLTITDTDGVAFGVNLQSTMTTLGDALTAINNAATGAGSSLVASINEDGTGLKLSDAPGVGPVTVTQAADSLAAVDLGLGFMTAGAFVQVSALDSTTGAGSPTGDILIGSRLMGGLSSIHRDQLNGGMDFTTAADLNGVRDGVLTITDKAGGAMSVNLAAQAVTTLAAGAAVNDTSISVTSTDGLAVGNELRLVGDGNARYRTVTKISGTTVFFDKALDVAFGAGRTVTGDNESLSDIVNNINYRAGLAGAAKVSARINDEGNGLLITDVSGGGGALTIAGVPVAGDLGIAGATTGTSINGSDLDPQYIGGNTLLATLNGGSGVQKGKISVTDTNGTAFTVDLSQDNDTTIGKVVNDLNGAAIGAGSGVRARVNDTGDGILVEDTTPGAGTLKVAEVGTTRTAQDLGIEGTAPSATPTRIDGSYELTIAVASGTSVKNLVNTINDALGPASATLLNDGGAINPYKISLASKTSGLAGRLVVDGNLTALRFSTTTGARDARLLYGTDGGVTDPIVITASSNRITGVVPGMTLDLKSVGASPVTITVARDTAGIAEQFSRFVENYNKTIDTIGDLASFDPESYKTGPLFSEGVVRTVRRDLASLVTSVVNEIPNGAIRSFSELGLSIASGGKVTLDSGKLQEALDSNFDEVEDVLTLQRKLKVDTLIEDLNNGAGIDDVQGTDDFRVVKRNGDYFDVDVTGSTTLGSLMSAINNDPANGGQVVAQISPDGFSLRLVDTSLVTRGVDAGPPAPDADSFVESGFIGSTVNFVGAKITITQAGPNNGQVRYVTGFDSVTGEFTLDSALPAALAPGDTYILERSIEVQNLNGSTAAADLKINKVATQGETTLQGDLVNLKNDPGLAFRFGERLDFLTRSDDGLISTRTDGIDDTIEGFNKSIERIEDRLQKMEERLVQQFARLEQMIAQSQSNLSVLSSQQAGLTSLAAQASLLR